jgi:predicted negative regulator of RcsB-dependent stress response
MYDLEEQEQIDALKAWWRQHGRLVIAAAVAAAVAAAGVNGWRYYTTTQAERASDLYATLEQALRGSDAKQVKEIATRLIDRYGSTGYGPMAALAAAKVNFDAGDLKSAANQLEWAMRHAKDEETEAIARLRLAGVRLDEGKHAEALELLDRKHPDPFAGLYADLRGDVLAAQGKTVEARAAYRLALEKLPAGATYRSLVQVKLDGLGSVQ